MEISLNTLSIVIPFLNEEENVLPLLSELHAVLTAIHFSEFEIIAIDDGCG